MFGFCTYSIAVCRTLISHWFFITRSTRLLATNTKHSNSLIVKTNNAKRKQANPIFVPLHLLLTAINWKDVVSIYYSEFTLYSYVIYVLGLVFHLEIEFSMQMKINCFWGNNNNNRPKSNEGEFNLCKISQTQCAVDNDDAFGSVYMNAAQILSFCSHTVDGTKYFAR